MSFDNYPFNAFSEEHDCGIKQSKRCAVCERGFNDFTKKLEQLLINSNADLKKSTELIYHYYQKSKACLIGNFANLLIQDIHNFFIYISFLRK